MVFLLCPLHTALDSCKLYLCWKSTKSFQEYFHPRTENFLQRFRETTKDHGASAEVSLGITSDRCVISNLHRLGLCPQMPMRSEAEYLGLVKSEFLNDTFCLSRRRTSFFHLVWVSSKRTGAKVVLH